MSGVLKTLLALWLLLLGVAQGKSVYTAEPPLGNFPLNFSKVLEFSPPETQARTRDFDRFGWDGASDPAYCHNDPINHVDVLGLASVAVNGSFSTGLDQVLPILTNSMGGEGLATLADLYPTGVENLEALVYADRNPGPTLTAADLRGPDFYAGKPVDDNSPMSRFWSVFDGIVNLPGDVGVGAFNIAMATDITSAPLEFNGWSRGVSIGEERPIGERLAGLGFIAIPGGRLEGSIVSAAERQLPRFARSEGGLLIHLADDAVNSVDFVRNTGTLAGKLASTRQINAAQRELAEYEVSLNRRYRGNGGSFDWGNSPSVSLMKHPTEIQLFHEMTHARQFAEIGRDAYGGFGRYARESHVFNQIWKSRRNFNRAEVRDSLLYVRDLRTLFRRGAID